MMGSKSNPSKFDCYTKAEPDEPMFVLLGRDIAAGEIVQAWAELREELGDTKLEVIQEARECAGAMRSWASKLGKDVDRARVTYQELDSILTLRGCVTRARAVWGAERLDAAGVLVRLTVDVGKLARYVRGATKDKRVCNSCIGSGKNLLAGSFLVGGPCADCRGLGRVSSLDLTLIMGNMIFSLIRWCDDLGLDPAECVRLAEEQQRRFAAENPER